MNQEIKLRNVKVNDAFWSEKQRLITDVVIPYQEAILNDEIENVEKSHAFANFRIAAGLEEGEFYGMVFQDSDVAKWLEGVAYSLVVKPDGELEKRADAVIDVIEKAQQPDGYLNTYFTLKEPEHRWQNLHECHELYCAGHMMEAAAAYYEATGKDKLLRVMERMADHIAGQFGPDKKSGIPGHQEIELGLMKLYHATGNEKYSDLAQYFIDERGKNPDYFREETEKRGWTHFGLDPSDTKYNQSFAPVREQKTAEGHSVRAVYMYTAMADIAGKTGEPELLQACETLWDNMTQKRMYVTGGIGSTVDGEAFSIDYDLPNDTVYAETCAAIGLVFFARKMLDIHPSGKYADVMERALYNGVLSGMQLDGKRFFYVNPLEVEPEISGKLHGYKHVLPERPGWYSCACCPPNVVRLLMSLGKYAWSSSEDTIYSHLYLGGSASFTQAVIDVESSYPWEGRVSYTVKPVREEQHFVLAVRIPSYAKECRILLNGEEWRNTVTEDGYVYLPRSWQTGDKVEVTFSMPVRKIYCNTAVRENEGCVALMRGPFVYCFEGVDNGGRLQELRIPENAEFTHSVMDTEPLKGMTAVEFDGIRVHSREELYSEEKPAQEKVRMKAIPYFAWGNRGKNQMKVWMLEK
ncbi:glycoside hydrolase family 127 protein [Eisenbergiella sp.]